MADEINGIDLGIEGLGPAEHIGRGGFADVYRAEQLSLRRTVAVKVLRSQASTPETDARFQRECHAIGAVSDHPHIIGVHHSGLTSNGRAYLVMEYLPGGSLTDRLHRNGPLPIPDVVATVAKIARALAVAHRAGVMHRDVKPANIMISAYGEPALGDFGIARIEGGHQTVTGQVTASIVHAAPEVLEGHNPTPATDIYSLGSTLFELAVGRAPYYDPTDESMWPVMKRILSESMPTPESVGFPPALGEVFCQATARNPLDRYQDGDELADALTALLDDPTALSVSAGYHGGPNGRGGSRQPPGDPDRTAVLAPAEMATTSIEPSVATPSPAGAPRLARPDLTAVQVQAPVLEPPGASFAGPHGLGGPATIGRRRRRRSLGDRLAVLVAALVALAGVASAAWLLLLPQLDVPLDRLGLPGEEDGGGPTLEVVGAATGPLRAGQSYSLMLAEAPAGATYRLVIDGQPRGEAGAAMPELVATAGRYQVQVEVIAETGVELSAPADVIVASDPLPGFRAHLARLPASGEATDDLIEAFDTLEADGHTGLEVLASGTVEGLSGEAWLLAVPGFADGEAAEEYCRSFELAIPGRCYAGLVEPVGR